MKSERERGRGGREGEGGDKRVMISTHHAHSRLQVIENDFFHEIDLMPPNHFRNVVQSIVTSHCDKERRDQLLARLREVKNIKQ